MDPTGIGMFELAERRLDWADRRQALLSQNIANANTPGFTPQDVAPFAGRLSLAMTTTNPLHEAGQGSASILAGSRPHERAPDGNAVTLEEQMGKVADTAATQALVANLYRKYAGLFRTALGRAG